MYIIILVYYYRQSSLQDTHCTHMAYLTGRDIQAAATAAPVMILTAPAEVAPDWDLVLPDMGCIERRYGAASVLTWLFLLGGADWCYVAEADGPHVRRYVRGTSHGIIDTFFLSKKSKTNLPPAKPRPVAPTSHGEGETTLETGAATTFGLPPYSFIIATFTRHGAAQRL